jgi:hypothetical protein
MDKDLRDSANKMKEGVSEGASSLKNKAAQKMDDFKESNLSVNNKTSNMMLWGLGGATAGTLMSLFVLKNSSTAMRV